MFEVGSDAILSIKSGMKKNDFRVDFARIVLLVLFFIFSIRIVQLGLESPNAKRRSVGNAAWQTLRADIVDRNGELLSGTAPGFFIKIYPGRIKDLAATKEVLEKIYPGFDASLVESKKTALYLNYIPLGPTDPAVLAAREIHQNWLDLEERRIRQYAKKRISAHILGFVGKDGAGLEGAEKFFDARLKSSAEPVALSIDSRIQSLLYQELSDAKNKYHANFAAGILMDSTTGEIIAAAQVPDFDPNDAGSSRAADRQFIPMRSVFEIGSIFKIFNTLLALKTDPNAKKKYDVSKPVQIGAATIHDKSSHSKTNFMNVEDIMVHSSNIGSARVALAQPAGVQAEFFRELGLYTPLNVDGLGRTAVWPERKNPQPIEVANMAFGHGISVSMMNLIAAVNGVANGGVFVQPRLTKAMAGEGIEGRRVVSADASKTLRRMMLRVSEETTGKLARVGGIDIASKTATAEKLVGGRYSDTKNLNSFVAVFPVEYPRYILLITIDEPQAIDGGGRTSAFNAVPVAGRVLDVAVPLLMK
ncbi:MAG: penicillin-binding protein 2 [Rickettsiales bacterium]|jgi:cell division protein FtsI (penicillin-binding protein 3)|nr:penicillin-binding protein 2 [Rickettsiales bacterium]